MVNLTSGIGGQFMSLLDAVAAERFGSPDDGIRSGASAIGPCVGDDRAPAPTGVTTLGPSVGDDNTNPSDLRLKEDVRRIGTTVFGLPLYRFKYIGRPETYEGAMAHEVLQVMPRAVSLGADGYHRVDYAALGTRMRRVS